MERSELAIIARDAEQFAGFCFEGLAGSRTRRNLGLCVQARLVDSRRKTHQPVAKVLARSDDDADALRQRLNRATLERWSDQTVRDRLREVAESAYPDAFAFVVDDTGLIKKGTKSPGVGRQYTGTAGTTANCQLLVSTHLAGFEGSVPLAMDVYLPKEWTEAPDRREAAGIPEDVAFRTKPELAVEQIRSLRSAGVGARVVLADAAYGLNKGFRRGVADLGLHYVVGVQGTLLVWRPGEGPDPVPPRRSGKGRPRTRRYPGKYQPVKARDLAQELSDADFQTITLDRGRQKPLCLEVAALRVRTASGAHKGDPPGDEEWLIIERRGRQELKFHLSSLSADTPLVELMDITKLRWRVERDYQDLKQEVGLAHYEGRTWRGLNHHLTICMAAFAFLCTRRVLFPPGDGPVPG